MVILTIYFVGLYLRSLRRRVAALLYSTDCSTLYCMLDSVENVVARHRLCGGPLKDECEPDVFSVMNDSLQTKLYS